jgi:hypothetical protein
MLFEVGIVLERTLEHDPEKWVPVFPRDKREAFCPEIMLKQKDGAG